MRPDHYLSDIEGEKKMQGYRMTIGRHPRPQEAAAFQKWLNDNLKNGYELESIVPTSDSNELWYVFRSIASGESFREFSDFKVDS
jgi:hypothetical protein